MSKRVVCIFAGKAFDEGVRRILNASHHLGAEIRCYDDAWLITRPFYQKNKWIFEAHEDGRHFGFGWCSWKPYIIGHEFARLTDDDMVMYLDADTFPIADTTPLWDLCERDGVVLFEEQGCSNRAFTRRECFEVMGRKLEEVPADERHACGRFQIFKANEQNGRFLMQWSAFNVRPECQLRRPSPGGDQPEFVRNSCEQSVLSNLAAIHKIPLHRTPDQNGWPINPGCGLPEDTYPQIFTQLWCDGDRGDVSGSRFFNVEAR